MFCRHFCLRNEMGGAWAGRAFSARPRVVACGQGQARSQTGRSRTAEICASAKGGNCNPIHDLPGSGERPGEGAGIRVIRQRTANLHCVGRNRKMRFQPYAVSAVIAAIVPSGCKYTVLMHTPYIGDDGIRLRATGQNNFVRLRSSKNKVDGNSQGSET